ncbi:MAG: hypothetical protein KAY24_06790, partial [Candidatus Eisenbacteria sp.]|nr:hypothetical protein [Candidatus Eisenbacteria bacterium]
PADALRWLRILLDVTARMRRSSRARVHLEIALAEMAALPKAVDLGRMLERLREEGGTGRGASHRAVTDEAAGNRRPRPQGGASLAPGATDPWRSASGSDAGGRMPPAVAPAVVAESANGPRGALGGATVLGTAEETCPDFEGGWQQVVARIGREKAFLGSCLHESCVTGLVDGRLQIALQDTNGFKREQVERPANRRLILRVIEEVLGRPLGICIIGRGEPAASGKQRKAANSLVSGERRTRAHDEIRDEGSQEAGSAAAPRGTAAQSAEARVKRIARLMDGDIVGPAL